MEPTTPHSQKKPRAAVLVGATAVGKTAVALALAAGIGAEIVNADSLQVYRELDIGTAKPNEAERAQVTHHLIDVVDPPEPYDAARYCREGRAAPGPPTPGAPGPLPPGPVRPRQTGPREAP